MYQRTKHYSSQRSEEYREKCPNCDEETFISGRCLSCNAWYSWPVKLQKQAYNTREQISDIILLQYSDTIYNSQVEIIKKTEKKNEKSFQIKVSHPGAIVQNKANFYDVWLEGEEQRYFKKKYVKPKYYFINTKEGSYSVHNWKTQRSTVIKEIKNLNTSELIKKILTSKN
jgi:hypothetical protein